MSDQRLWEAGAAWIDGEIIPISEAKISVLDWGLTHSDITYDVVHAWQGRFFRLNDYLARFEESLEKCRLSVSQTRDEQREILHAIVSRSGLLDAYVSMVASRGSPTIPGSRDPRHCANHFYAWCVPFIWVFQPDIIERGARLFLPEAIHRIPASSVDPTAKNCHWGDFTRGLIEAKETGFDNTLLADKNGFVTEGPGFNIFMVKDAALLTPKAGMLEGITRRTAVEICGTLGLPCTEDDISVDEFLEADEIFATTTGGGIVPVTRVNDRVFSNGSPGPITRRLSGAYWALHDDPEYGETIDYSRFSGR
jgi:branched-chain amino acid aminotransferase